MNVTDLATADLVTVSPDAPAEHALKLMHEQRIRHLPVVDNAGLTGMLSDRDMLKISGWLDTWDRLMEETTFITSVPVRNLMSSPVTTLTPDASLKTLVHTMLDRRISAVPLVNDGQLVGLVTETDVLLGFGGMDESAEVVAWQRSRVADHMTELTVSACPTDEVRSAVALMREHGIRHLPVLMGGNLLGIVSERDLQQALASDAVVNLTEAENELAPRYTSQLRDIMTQNVVTCGPFTCLPAAAEQLLLHKIGALPVTADDEMHGIITESDLLRAMFPRSTRREST